ncbi:MAG: universal stress protein [Psychromonas sp.]
MSYRHILITVDFHDGSRKVIDKGVKLAKALNAKISLIHINNRITEEAGFGDLMDMNLGGLEPAHTTSSDLSKRLDDLAADIDYSIENKFLIKGDISHDLEESVKATDIDLIVCGHHHDFWSRLKPSAGNLVNTALVDLLIVPLQG